LQTIPPVTNVPPLQLPDGAHADLEEMSTFGRTLQKFIAQQEQLLDEIVDIDHHNEIIDFLNVLADTYNEQLTLFKEAEGERQERLFEAMVTLAMNEPQDFRPRR